MSRGTLKSFDHKRGIGVITNSEGVDLIVYKDSLEPKELVLRSGQSVEFRTYHGPNGMLAESVRSARRN